MNLNLNLNIYIIFFTRTHLQTSKAHQFSMPLQVSKVPLWVQGPVVMVCKGRNFLHHCAQGPMFSSGGVWGVHMQLHVMSDLGTTQPYILLLLLMTYDHTLQIRVLYTGFLPQMELRQIPEMGWSCSACALWTTDWKVDTEVPKAICPPAMARLKNHSREFLLSVCLGLSLFPLTEIIYDVHSTSRTRAAWSDMMGLSSWIFMTQYIKSNISCSMLPCLKETVPYLPATNHWNSPGLVLWDAAPTGLLSDVVENIPNSVDSG